VEDRGTYLLYELDGIFVGDHIKKFHPRCGVESVENADDAKDDGGTENDEDGKDT